MTFKTILRKSEVRYDEHGPGVVETVEACEYAVTDGAVIEQSADFGRRRRRFTIEYIGIRWTWNKNGHRRYITARGATLLVNGQRSTKSEGFHAWHQENQHELLQEIRLLAENEELSWVSAD